MSSKNGHLTTQEAAALLGVHRTRIGQFCQAGLLTDTEKTAGQSRLWVRAEVEALKREREAPPAGACGYCGCIEDVRGGLCWICRLEERQPWNKRRPCVFRPAVRRGRVATEG